MVDSKGLRSLNDIINQIKEDFSFISENPNILGVFLYGSTIYRAHHHRSDIDVCVVTKYKKLVKAYNYIMENLNRNIHEYDIRFFKGLPLKIQGEIMENGVLVVSKNKYELYEYLFPYRKKYEDWKFKITYCM
ncbi:MAG: hypothetical protein GF383_09625 [Candidatus Lokiarchaeota archaeon]|nr:hypothetical protein [Candidatus Lokiarchaeota archaeon]MBD3340772.1 hypothetical protein [Candidatus Lokiarchaeota archaeon]